jgi:tetratricopeptide (TPR) repeat protein
VVRGLSILSLLSMTAGCTVGWGPASGPPGPSEAAQLVARADTLAAAGQGRAAQYLYQQVVREYPGDHAAAALYGLGRLETDPARSQRDYRAAYAAFSQILTDYPQSRWAPDARTWQAMLGDLLAHEEDAARTKVLLRWREEEAARLRLQMQQLKSVDLGLERPR